VLEGLGEGDEAESVLERALDVARAKSSNDPLGVLPYADLIRRRLQRREEVGPLLAEARAAYPGNCLLLYLEGEDLIVRGAYDDAIDRFDRILRFDPTQVGWGLVGGTSEATPIFSGIVALADQVAGHRLGDINAALYALGAQSLQKNSAGSTGIVDVTAGDNSYDGVTGYQAGPGFDLASGWGTIDAAKFVPALAQY